MGPVGKTIVAGLVATISALGAAAYATGVPELPTVVSSAGEPSPTVTPGRSPATGRVVVVVAAGAKPAASARGTVGASARRTTVAATATASSVVPLCASSSERQLRVEKALSSLQPYRTVTVDGRQSPADCTIIRRFQQRFGIQPPHGQADETTADVAERIAASSTPSRQQCGARPGITACVDLTLQTVSLMRDGVIVFGPTVIRSGFRGYATPTGTYSINKRELREWSDPYRVWLPYWQRFVGGIGFHQTTTYLHDGTLGSHGCINLLPADAAEMFHQLRLGSTVQVVGRRPGT